MDKKVMLKEEIKELERLQQEEHLKAQKIYLEYQQRIKKKKRELEEYENQTQKNYRKFPFTLYKEAPQLKTLIAFEFRGWRSIPYYVGGKFDVMELAEIIKQAYQLEKKEEYAIVVTALTDQRKEWTHKDIIHKEEKTTLIPKLYIMIGKKQIMQQFADLNGKFNNLTNFSTIKSAIEHTHGKDLITISINQTDHLANALDLECFSGSVQDKNGYVNYYDFLSDEQKACLFNRYQQIIIPDLSQIRFNGSHSFRHNKDLLNFEVYQEDKFIGDILTSICLYKKSNAIWQLNQEDYNHIFNTLYGKNVDIIGLAQEDFPKSLEYEGDYTRTL